MKLLFACVSSPETDEGTEPAASANEQQISAKNVSGDDKTIATSSSNNAEGVVNNNNNEGDSNMKPKSFYQQLRKAFRFGRRISISKPIPIAAAENVAADKGEHADKQQQQQPMSAIPEDDVDGPKATSPSTALTTTTTSQPQPTPAEPRDTNNENISYGWFWGNISRRDAENLLHGKEDGSFLVRESSDKRFLYSLTFRSNGKTMHTRIEYLNGRFSFYSADGRAAHSTDSCVTLAELIQEAMSHTSNAEGIFFYSRSGNTNNSSLYTVHLNQPLSRYQYVIDFAFPPEQPCRSLQYLCKFVVHHSPVARARMHALVDTLPSHITKFLADSYFFPNHRHH